MGQTRLLMAVAAALCVTQVAQAYDIQNRWSSTQTDGGGLTWGDPTTILWSVVPDGENYSRANNSQVIDYLDDGWNVAAVDRTPDLTNRPWWAIMDRVYDQYTRVSGVTMTYVHEQNPDGTDSGQWGDIRIGGQIIDNDPGGYLADNAFPNNGDMKIDTSRTASGDPSWWHSSSAPAQFRNLISHESGHGMGLSHDTLSGANAVMETPLQSNFWGLQFDDVYAFNRMYGDPLEKNGGNDSAATAVALGNLVTGGPVVMGTDADDASVGEFDDDWLGIDTNTDEDWFSVDSTGPTNLAVSITPMGPTYTTGEQGLMDTSARNDLFFEVFQEQGDGSLVSVYADRDLGGLGATEAVDRIRLADAGRYYVRVSGHDVLNQFYQLDASASAFSYNTNDPTIVNDDFNLVFSSSSDDLNEARTFRQTLGRADSTWSVSTTNPNVTDPADVADIYQNQLRVVSAHDSATTENETVAQLDRNLYTELAGKSWSMSFDVELEIDPGVTGGLFGFALLDERHSDSPLHVDSQVVLQLQSSGVLSITTQGGPIGGGAFVINTWSGNNHTVELVAREQADGGSAAFDLRFNGGVMLSNFTVNLQELGRYFAFVTDTSAAGADGDAYTALINNLLLTELTTRGDVDRDHDTDADDIDELYGSFGEVLSWYDVAGDGGGASQADVDALVRDVLGTEYGDANLDQLVSLLDLNTMGANFGGAGDWSMGDFTGDGQVSLLDLNILGANFGFDGTEPASTPEPMSALLLGLGALVFTRRGR